MNYSIMKRYWDNDPNYSKRKHTDIYIGVDVDTARELVKQAGKDLRCANSTVIYKGYERNIEVTVYILKTNQ